MQFLFSETLFYNNASENIKIARNKLFYNDYKIM